MDLFFRLSEETRHTLFHFDEASETELRAKIAARAKHSTGNIKLSKMT